MSRIFISHSHKDRVQALAFQRWLEANGWARDDVFIDLHGIGAGERWRDTLRKANAKCEAVILLASPSSLASVECQKELELAEALGKPIIPVILRDLKVDDPLLARYADRQFVDLAQEPTERMEAFEHDGRMHRVEFNTTALASIRTRLEDLGIAPGTFAWPPKDRPNAEPYPGLSALGEDDAGIFFGRDADIMSGLTELRLVRRRGSPRVVVIQAASGAGKSSYLRAGLWPRLERDRDFAPLAILRPAQGILSGPDGLGFQLAPWFARYGKRKTPGAINTAVGAATEAASSMGFSTLLVEAAAVCTAAQRATAPDAKPPAPLIAIDQAEELFAAEDARESDRFLNMLAALLKAPPDGVDPYVLITIRADSVENLLQWVAAVGLDAPKPLYLPPLSPAAYRDVIVKPAEVYTRHVNRLAIEPALVDKLVADATGADALPLLAFTLSQLFKLHAAGHDLTLNQYNAIGGMAGCVNRVLGQAQRVAGAAGSDDNLRRLMVPGLATWDPVANAAKRLVAREAEVIGGNRAGLAPLVHALVQNRLLVRNRDTLEVAHEALLRRPPIDGWLEEQKDALKLRDDVQREAEEWKAHQKGDLLLVRRGERLGNAMELLANPDFASALAPAAEYLDACRKVERAVASRARRTKVVVGTLAASVLGVVGLGLAGWLDVNRIILHAKVLGDRHGPSRALTEAQERSLKPGDQFQECMSCPDMIVVPAGSFIMGSPETEKGRARDEGPQRKVTIGKPFAVGRFEVTFDEWDGCVAHGGCPTHGIGSPFGRGRQPLINVSWIEAQSYTKWLSKQTGKDYRLLTEAEWEYAARAGTSTRFYFGDDEAAIGEHAWWEGNSSGRTHAVGEKNKPNPYGLHDFHGNVWEWVQDCFVDNYKDAPTDGGAVPGRENCSRALRGGSWFNLPGWLRSARRFVNRPEQRNGILGLRVARTLPHTP